VIGDATAAGLPVKAKAKAKAKAKTSESMGDHGSDIAGADQGQRWRRLCCGG
jgi:hypothetical protein